MPRLLLFDIDQTLIRTDGAGRMAMDRALEDVLGVPEVSKGIPFDGRTDYGIFLEALGRHSETPLELLPAMQEAYLRYLPGALQERGGIVLEGVGELLDALDSEGAAMGVATGTCAVARRPSWATSGSGRGSAAAGSETTCWFAAS